MTSPTEPMGMERADLRKLRERVAGLTGPDREIDFDLARALGFKMIEPTPERLKALGLRYDTPKIDMSEERKFGRWDEEVPPWSASIDAALAFVERVLTGHWNGDWTWYLSNRAYDDGLYKGDGLYQCRINHPLSSGGGPRWDGFAPTAPLAILLALLDALISQEQPDD